MYAEYKKNAMKTFYAKKKNKKEETRQINIF